MMLPVLGFLFALLATVGTAVPAALVEARQGRESFHAAVAHAAARAGLAESLNGSWTVVAVGSPIGAATPVPAISTELGMTVNRRAVRLTASVWLLAAEATIRDQGSEILAKATEGLMVHLVLAPGDSVPRPVAITRPWVVAFQ